MKYLQNQRQSNAMKNTRPSVMRPNHCDLRSSNNAFESIVQKPKRPMSPFFLYRSEMAKTEKIKSSEAALRWRNLGAQQRQFFHQQHQIQQNQYK